jgi:hypothetical protein
MGAHSKTIAKAFMSVRRVDILPSYPFLRTCAARCLKYFTLIFIPFIAYHGAFISIFSFMTLAHHFVCLRIFNQNAR